MSRVKVSALMDPVCSASVAACLPVFMSQAMTVPSALPLTATLPSGEKPTAVTTLR